MPARSHVGWGFLLSLLLHATGIAALSLALPRLNVKPGVLRSVDFAVEAPAERAPSRDETIEILPPAAAAVTEQVPEAPPSASSPTPQPSAAVTATEAPTAAVEVSPAPAPVVETPVKAPAPRPVAAPIRKPQPKPVAAATPANVPSATHADPRSDGSALQRVLQQIAATTELTHDERRRAMMVVLRTWEDPSGKRSAEELIDALLAERLKARTTSAPEPER